MVDHVTLLYFCTHAPFLAMQAGGTDQPAPPRRLAAVRGLVGPTHTRECCCATACTRCQHVDPRCPCASSIVIIYRIIYHLCDLGDGPGESEQPKAYTYATHNFSCTAHGESARGMHATDAASASALHARAAGATTYSLALASQTQRHDITLWPGAPQYIGIFWRERKRQATGSGK